MEFEVVNGALDAIMGTNAAADYTDANTLKIWQFKTLGSFVMW